MKINPIRLGALAIAGCYLALANQRTMTPGLDSILKGSGPAGDWTVATVPARKGEPLLKVRQLADGSVLLYWPSVPAGFQLQEMTNLVKGMWGPAKEKVEEKDGDRVVRLHPSSGVYFYRLEAVK